MPPFEPPGLTRAKNKAWTKVAKADFRDPDLLWTDYWARFNSMSIPILDEDAFFADALAAARVAENREHLEQILEQKSRDRRAELADIVSSIAVAAISVRTPFSTPASRSAALKVGQTGSLDSFVQLACGVAFSRDNGQSEMRDPWELENAFPPDLYDVHDATADDKYSSEPYDGDLERVAEIADGEGFTGVPIYSVLDILEAPSHRPAPKLSVIERAVNVRDTVI
ncbi:hypothetical protein K4K60_005892 [Colletotrichum sp. SAR11_57]|nr:hypothetical protein K4K60_005892 [Colletotrichum sp. SAR11_57]